MKRVCIVTSGHLSTCPRMVKAADALHEAGYAVRVVSANYIAWAREADQRLRESRRWAWSVFDYEKSRARLDYFKTGVRFKLVQQWARTRGPEWSPFALAARAFSRAYPELLRLVLREPVDFICGGTSGGLPVAFAAAQKLGVPFALDLEDFHSAEQDDNPDSRLAHALITRIETLTLRQAAFLTAGSQGIAEAYERKYSIRPQVVNNTFPLPDSPPTFAAAPRGQLKLYWFSQTIGANRGLEDVVEAMGVAGVSGELHLRGRAAASYIGKLNTMVAARAPSLKLQIHPPASPGEMIKLAGHYEVGLSTEPGFSENNRLALSNKVFTYMSAGLALVLTDTAGHRPLIADLGGSACVYSPGDKRVLATKLERWANDKPALLVARESAWQAAQRRWHWEHPAERGALLQAFENAIKRN
ncbi:MAG: hypothetical protein IH623_07095 [Verrucomicrobia bacterium]|nr:hypothetical protein [Verrucomicrobiota bacterium]